MSLQAILAKIDADSKAQAAEIIQSANRECNDALHLVNSRIKEKHHRDTDRIKKKIEAASKQMENHARREMEKALLSHRRKIVDKTIEEAVMKIASAPDYLTLIECLLNNCDLQGNVEVVICANDRERITPDFLKRMSTDSSHFVRAGEYHDDHGGIVMRSGDISLNATLSMIAELNHDSMVMELSRLLPVEERAE